MIRVPWWPQGHHHPARHQDNPEISQMTFQEALDLAEIEADIAQDRYAEAFEADKHPQLIEQLDTEATLARHRYYAALNADLAL